MKDLDKSNEMTGTIDQNKAGRDDLEEINNSDQECVS